MQIPLIDRLTWHPIQESPGIAPIRFGGLNADFITVPAESCKWYNLYLLRYTDHPVFPVSYTELHYHEIDEELLGTKYDGPVQGDHCIHPRALEAWVNMQPKGRVILPIPIYYAVAGMWWENQC